MSRLATFHKQKPSNDQAERTDQAVETPRSLPDLSRGGSSGRRYRRLVREALDIQIGKLARRLAWVEATGSRLPLASNGRARKMAEVLVLKGLIEHAQKLKEETGR